VITTREGWYVVLAGGKGLGGSQGGVRGGGSRDCVIRGAGEAAKEEKEVSRTEDLIQALKGRTRKTLLRKGCRVGGGGPR